MTIRIRTLSHLPAALVVLGLAGVAQSSLAASTCKGMALEACASDAQCAWVDSYIRKDGRTVAAHCKLKPRRPGQEQASLGIGTGGTQPLSPGR
jgi:hypothetical protein